MNKQDKRDEMRTLAVDLAEKIGEARQIWETIEDMGYSDHYIKQELYTEYMNSLAQKVDELEEDMQRVWDEEDEVEQL